MADDLLLVLALAAAVVGLALAAAMVARLVGIARRPALARAPVAPATPVTFAQAGPAELAVEAPRFTPGLGRLTFELLDPAGGSLRMRRPWLRTTRSARALVRTALYRLVIPRPATYTLRIAGIDPAADYADAAVVFVRPAGPAAVATVVALLAAVGLAAGGAATIGALFVGTAPPPSGEPAPAGPTARPRPFDTPALAVPDGDVQGGRRLASDPARLRDGREVEWPLLQMRVRVPAGWVVRRQSTTELELGDPATPSTFLAARAAPMPAGPSVDEYLQAQLVHAQAGLASARIEGYAVRRIGAVGGVLTLERRAGDAAWVVAWTSFQPAELGSLSVTLLAGASADDFTRDEPLLGAIVDSIRFD